MTTIPAFLNVTSAASCATSDHDPELWHSIDPPDEAAAKQICGTCPLLLACQAHAIDNDERFGTWGALTAGDRHRLRTTDGSWLDAASRVRLPCGTARAYSAHHKFGETPCDVCVAGHEARVLKQRLRLLEAAHAAGGTYPGAQMHRRMGEAACGPCKAAQARYNASRPRTLQRDSQAHTQAVAA
ncbi:WhiB family transcriptional regulator [Streptomyces sp. NPDC055036]